MLTTTINILMFVCFWWSWLVRGRPFSTYVVRGRPFSTYAQRGGDTSNANACMWGLRRMYICTPRKGGGWNLYNNLSTFTYKWCLVTDDENNQEPNDDVTGAIYSRFYFSVGGWKSTHAYRGRGSSFAFCFFAYMLNGLSRRVCKKTDLVVRSITSNLEVNFSKLNKVWEKLFVEK